MSSLRAAWKPLAGIVATIATIIGILDVLIFKWGLLAFLSRAPEALYSFFAIHWIPIAFGLFAMLLAYFHYQFRLLERYIAPSFTDGFRGELRKNWDYQGDWEVVHGGGELSVTNSEFGGITRVGHLWRDYSFEFTVVIVNDRIGWLLRAQDLFNYYMIQLTPTMVRPHLRIAGNWVLLDEKDHCQPIELSKPIRIRTEVRGSEVRVYANDHEVYYAKDLFSAKFLRITKGELLEVAALQPNVLAVPSFTTGRVGFRMSGSEHCRIGRCTVRPL